MEYAIQVIWADRKLGCTFYEYHSKELALEHWKGFMKQKSVYKLVLLDMDLNVLDYWHSQE